MDTKLCSGRTHLCCRPASLEPLSSMLLSPELFVQRCCSTSLWGEKCVLTFALKLRSEQELK
jgi:hypothetical protein